MQQETPREDQMKVMKTIVATAVIVFALTTAAMAGVQHVTRPSSQAGGAPAQQTQPATTVTLTGEQFAQLLAGQRKTVTPRETHKARETRQARTTQRHAADDTDGRRSESHESRSSATGSASHVRTSSGGTHHVEVDHGAAQSDHSGGSHSGDSHSGGHD
jgi:hypothetical protein